MRQIQRVSKPDQQGLPSLIHLAFKYILLAPKKTDNDVEIVKIVNVFKKNWTIAILMRKDVPNPEKLVWGPYD